jgi:hypothetical protein
MDARGLVVHPFKKLSMITWSVGAEIFEDIRQRGFWHINIEQVVAKRDLAPLDLILQTFIQPTMLSFAPLSPLKNIGVELTPSYTTPFGNMV